MKNKQALRTARRRVEGLGADLERLAGQLQAEKRARIKAEKGQRDRDVLAREVVRLRELNSTGSSDELVQAQKDRDRAHKHVRALMLIVANRDDFCDAAMKVVRRQKGEGVSALEAVLTELRGQDTTILLHSPNASTKSGSRHVKAMEARRRKKAMRGTDPASRPR